MKVKSTKSALLMSFTSLLLCFAMLIGCTFAWFTDSVTSGVNKIQAGNLDIEVYHTNKTVTNDEKIDNKTDLFKDVTLWEPGAVAYENITIKNVGSLAAKYVLSLNVADKNTLNGKDLTEVIKVAVVDNGFTGEREEAQTLTGYQTLASFQKDGILDATTGTSTFGVVLYWAPTENDNLYNANNGKATSDGQPLFVNVGINVVATQRTAEADSFDDQYDAGAVYPVLAQPVSSFIQKEANVTADSKLATATELKGTTIPAGTVLYTDNNTTPLTSTALTGKLQEEVKTTAQTETSMTLDVSYTYVQSDNTSTPIHGFSNPLTHVYQLSTGLEEVKVTHSGTAMTAASAEDSIPDGQYFYNPATGKLTVVSSTYSVYVVSFKSSFAAAVGSQGYGTLQEAFTAAKSNDTVTLLKDIDLAAQVEISGKEITLNMAGRTIKYVGETGLSSGVLLVHNGAGLTVTGNGKVESGEEAYAAIALTKQGDSDATPAKLTVQNGTFIGNYYAIVGNGSRHNTEITINDGKFSALDGLAVYHPQNGTMTVKGGTFTGTESAIELRAGTLNITGGTFTATATPTSVTANGNGTTSKGAAIAIAQHTTKLPISVNITGGNFNAYTAIYESNPQNNDAESIAKVQMSIAGGTFTATQDGTLAVYSEDCKNFITGGTFSTDPSDYVAAPYYVNGETAPFTIAECKNHTYGKDDICTICGDVKVNAITTQEELATAFATAKSGDTIVLGAGEFNLNVFPEGTFKDKDITLVGNGIDSTILKYGSEKSGGDGPLSYVFGGANKVTIQKVTLRDQSSIAYSGTDAYTRGFARMGDTQFDYCKFENTVGQIGNRTVVANNCIFNSANYYDIVTYEAANYTFNNCTFNGNNSKGWIQLYRTGDKNTAYNVTVNNCTFNKNSSTSAKTPIYAYDNTGNGGIWNIYITGTNENVGNLFTVNEASNSWIYGVFSGSSKMDQVYVDGALVWQNGEKVG